MTERTRRGRLTLTLRVDLDRAQVLAKIQEQLALAEGEPVKLVGRGDKLRIRFDRTRAPGLSYEVAPTVVRLRVTDTPPHTTVVATAGRKLNGKEMQKLLNLTALMGGTNFFGDIVGIRRERKRRREEAVYMLNLVSAALGEFVVPDGDSAYRNPARRE